MNLFSRSPAEKDEVEARKALQEGNPKEGLRLLSFGFSADPSHKPLYRLAIQCLEQLESEQEANLFKAALSKFNDSQAFYDLGYYFVDAGLNRWAIPFLERANMLDPSDIWVASELAVAYTAHFQPGKGRDVLSRVSYQRDFWSEFQYHWCSLLCNETRGIEKYIESTRREIQRSAPDPQAAGGCLDALDRLEEALHRLVVISKPEPIIQHWHFIQYGSAVLDYFDDRTEPGGLSVAGGRWVAVWGSMTEVISIIRKLERFLKELDRQPQVVLGLPDRDSQIIGRTIAQVLGIPFEEATEDRICQPDSLVVTADNRLTVHPALGEVLENQTLFSFNHHWLSDASYTPDVIGLMSQTCTLPWSGGNMQVDPETREITRTEPDERPVPLIVQDIVSTEAEEDPRFSEIIGFYKNVAPHLKGGVEGGSRRLRFRTDSPVPGSYFC